MRRLTRTLLYLAIVGAVLVAAPATWSRISSAGHLFAVDAAPAAPVAIVFGAELAPGGQAPKPFLRGRLDVAAELYRTGRVRALLVSGDARGYSGNETRTMTNYLVGLGVPAARIVSDGFGLDSYDTCVRAKEVFGVTRALLVSQSFHLVRAVTLCRRLGVDADGVAARCEGCQNSTLAKNRVRDFFSCGKAAYDLLSGRGPAIGSPKDPAIQNALTA